MKLIEIPTCPTKAVRELDRQLIYKMNEIAPNSLVAFDDLDLDVGESVWAYLQPAAKAALEQAIQARGIRLFVNSAYRTIAQQHLLFGQFRAGRCGIMAAAPPGGSNHQSGLALDVEDAAGWRPVLEEFGWIWLGPHDPMHFDYMGDHTQDVRALAVEAFQKLWNENQPNSPLEVDGQYGPQTEACLSIAPSDGFAKGDKIPVRAASPHRMRSLFLTDPIMEGDDVLQVQQALNKVGASLVADGFFGPATELAVKKFQGLHGLHPDGIVGAGTRGKLGI